MYARPVVIIKALAWCTVLVSMVAVATDASKVHPTITVVDGAQSGDLGTISTENSSFAGSVRLESSVNGSETGLALKASVVVDPSDGQAAIELDGRAGKLVIGSLPAKSSRLVRISGVLPVPGRYHFSLIVSHADGRAQKYGLEVERTAPELELTEAKGAVVTLQANTRDYQTQLLLRANTRVLAERVRVAVPSLLDPEGKPVAVRVGDGYANALLGTIEGYGARPFKLEAVLNRTGTYNGTLLVSYLGGSKTYAISIVKTLAVTSLSASVAASGATMAGDSSVLSLHLGVRETAGIPVGLEQPSVIGLKRTLGTAEAVAARYRKTTFYGSDDKPVVNWPLRLAANGVYDLRLDVSGIDEPGRYSGKLLIPAEDRSPLEVNITFDVKRHWAIAAGVIAAGLVVSFLMGLWGTRLRPRMKALGSVLEEQQLLLKTRAIAAPSSAELPVFEALQQQLALLYEGLRNGTEESAEPLLSVVRNKRLLVLDWVSLNKQLLGLKPARVYRPLRRDIDSVRDYLIAPETQEGEHVGAKTLLATMPSKIKVAMNDLLSDFLQTLEQLAEEMGDSALNDPWRKRVVDRVEAAKDAFERDDLTYAGKAIDEARLSAAQLLSQVLRKNFPVGDPPGWMTVDRFARIGVLLDEVGAATSGDAAVYSYREALLLYLEPNSREINKRLRDLGAYLEKYLAKVTGDAESAKAAIVEISHAQTKLSGVSALLREGKLGEAAVACREAEHTYTHLRENLPLAAQPSSDARVLARSTSAVAGVNDVPEPVITLPAPRFPVSPEDSQATFDQVRNTSRMIDWLYQLVVALVAVALGLYVLWVGTPTWGSAGDILVAALWGLGLHALSTGPTTYKGLSDLAGKLRT